MPSLTKSKVYFFFEVQVSLRNRSVLKRFLEDIIKKENRKLEGINYIFCSDKRLLEINRQFLQHDFYTDIITFELSAKHQPINAEIYISIDRVRENARVLRLPFSHELLRVMIHGILHLCGYSDKSPRQQKNMREKEDHYLKNYSRG